MDGAVNSSLPHGWATPKDLPRLLESMGASRAVSKTCIGRRVKPVEAVATCSH